MAGPEVAVEAGLRQQIVDVTARLLVRMLRKDVPVTESTRLMDELGLSSSQAMELLLELENELSIMIDVEELDQQDAYTLGELADYVAGHSTAM